MAATFGDGADGLDELMADMQRQKTVFSFMCQGADEKRKIPCLAMVETIGELIGKTKKTQDVMRRFQEIAKDLH
ncbi:unnamed protein product, partial [Mesorhabditis spiculigera]